MNDYLEALQGEHRLLLNALPSYYPSAERTGRAIRQMMETGRANRIIFAGMGSSLYAAKSVLAQLNQNGFFSLAVNAYELITQMPGMVDQKTILVGISQSGNTPEVITLMKYAKTTAAMTVAMFNQEESQLKGLAGEELMLGVGRETPISNKTYYAQVAQLQVLACAILGEFFRDVTKEIHKAVDWHQIYVENQQERTLPIIEFLAGTRLLDLLGDGAQGGAAQQAGLVLREMTKFNVSSLSASDFSHGWFDTAGCGHTAVYFCDEITALDQKMIEHCLSQGSKVLLLCAGEYLMRHKHLMKISLPQGKGGLLPLYSVVPFYFLAGIGKEKEEIGKDSWQSGEVK
ncbi:MAG: SIS domain-containing protein [Lachnospiraceae bacterium]|nr:SIS domain-containing protein [Lachnospiraceae bacterium]